MPGLAGTWTKENENDSGYGIVLGDQVVGGFFSLPAGKPLSSIVSGIIRQGMYVYNPSDLHYYRRTSAGTWLDVGTELGAGEKGDKGDQGDPGLSAYQIWLQAGGSGTEADFLDSLKGDDGYVGADGASAFDIWNEANGGGGTYADFIAAITGPAGADGADGADGAAGAAGANGASVWRAYADDASGSNKALVNNGTTHKYYSDQIAASQPDISTYTGPWYLVLSDAGLNASSILTQSGTKISATASGTNAYAAAITPAIASLTAGQRWFIQFTNANTGTGTPTLNLNALGAKDLAKPGGATWAAGEIAAGAILLLAYDGTKYQVLGGLRNAALAAAQKTGVNLAFTEPAIYGTPTVPETALSITADLAGAVVGMVVLLHHNAGSNPTFDVTKFTKYSVSGNYANGVLNYIYCHLVAPTVIKYTITQ